MTDETASVLIVDDTPEKLVALESVLIGLPVRIVKAGSGREALRRLLAEDFAVILLDVRMPGMDGFETAALIRQRPRSANTPIIFVTAFGDETHVARGYSLRAVDYITTPIVPEVLRTKVSVLVELFQTAAHVRRQADSLRQQASQLHRLTLASLAIHSAPGVDAMLEVVTRSACDILGAARAHASARLDDRRTIAAIAGEPGREELDIAVAAVVARTNRVYRGTRDLHPAGDGDQPADATAETVDVLAVPLVTRDGRNMGAIQVARAGAAPHFADEDEDLLLQLARMTSIAIENTLVGEMREANRLKDEFIATVSHELRTPLNALRSWAYVLRAPTLAPDKMRRAVEAIERNVIAQARIVDDLLDVSRIVTGKLRLNTRLVDLAPIIDAAIESIAATAEAKGVRIVRSLDTPTALVLGDADRLQQVVWNLLSNAVKFTPAAGRVDVGLAAVGTDVTVRVADTGQGIRPDFVPHVFERFRQADASSTRATGGLGLGLAIVRHLVELHGGSVGVESAGEGLGATFTFTVPAAAETTGVTPTADDRVPDTHVDLSGLRVLVVEDEPDTRDALATVITGAGGHATAVGTVAEAIAALSTTGADVIVCDIGLPGEDGYSLIRKLRTVGGTTIPAIALTAYAQESDRRRALAAGFQAHLAKPVQPGRLLHALATGVPARLPALPVVKAGNGASAGSLQAH
ncbi:MAG TPA: response regulator [Candidatus Binatia bacterium]|nr:response regulator [Candidatus Binatia bacterium]